MAWKLETPTPAKTPKESTPGTPESRLRIRLQLYSRRQSRSQEENENSVKVGKFNIKTKVARHASKPWLSVEQEGARPLPSPETRGGKVPIELGQSCWHCHFKKLSFNSLFLNYTSEKRRLDAAAAAERVPERVRGRRWGRGWRRRRRGAGRPPSARPTTSRGGGVQVPAEEGRVKLRYKLNLGRFYNIGIFRKCLKLTGSLTRCFCAILAAFNHDMSYLVRLAF